MPKKNQKKKSAIQTPKDKVLKCLEKNCLLPGTSLNESGRTFSIRKKRGEKVRFFHLDKGRKRNQGTGRKCLGISPNERICDLLVVIATKKSSAYIFVELKVGQATDDAFSQLRDTIKSAQQKTQCTSQQVYGLIACRGSSPIPVRKERKRNPGIKIKSRTLQPSISVTELMKIFNP